MLKIKQLLKSRQMWVLLGIGLYNGLDSVKELVPVEYQAVVNFVLVILAAYFRLSPKSGL